jgi:uncharacterized membrane protein
MDIKRESVTTTRIPVPSKILKGEWYGTVYAIDTESASVDHHNQIVAKVEESLVEDFDNNNHYTVSLRHVKRELVFEDERTGHYCTLTQFRVRDSY